MLLDVRDPAIKSRFSRLLVPGIIGGAIFLAALAHAVSALVVPSGTGGAFGLREFSVAFLNEYWLHFELTSVLLLAAVVAALAVIKGGTRRASEGERRG
jgi:NADH-quinone oxidoreductase subunit J